MAFPEVFLQRPKPSTPENATMMATATATATATAPGRTAQVADRLDAVKGGFVGRTYARLGYVRATVPTGRADAATAAAAKLYSVRVIDLGPTIRLDDPVQPPCA
ncbi:hypothetical protein ACH45E_07585 [Streptomyces sp. NPDC020299]|uniref:hypothetical protein n=1 Tax=Streptomyces sp. NPDC020299 TaxID=3365067 RepID=UPI0037B7094E